MQTLTLALVSALTVLTPAEPAPFPGKVSRWEGFVRHDFAVDGTNALVVVPDRPLPGRPWVWRGEFFGAFAKADADLVRAGWHLVYLSVPDQFGGPKAMAKWATFHEKLVKDYRLHPRAALIGLSRGALYCLAWAAKYPDKTLAVYLDNGVCDYRSWPGGKPKGLGTGSGSTGEWGKLLKAYGFKTDAEAIASKANPIENLAPMAKASIPLLLVYGDSDRVVPHRENSEIVYERYRKLGGPVERIVKPGADHHPHGLTDTRPVLRFFEKARRGEPMIYLSIAAEKRLARYSMDPETGDLTHRGDLTLDGEPGALTVCPERRFLFVAHRSTGKLASYRIERPTGALTHLGTVDAGPDPAHLSVDATGKWLLAAYYVDAKVTVHRIEKDGSLGKKAHQSIPTADKAHAIVPDPSNRFVFVPHTGPDVVFQFTFDASTGKLTANTPAKFATPKGTGPRHLAFHPTKPLAVIDNEQGSSLTTYSLDKKTGTLSPVATKSTLPDTFKETNACAEVKLHPSGRFAYVSNRGHDSIAVFELKDDGTLTTLDRTATEKTPRSFDLDSTGQFLFAAGEGSGKLAAYRIDAKTGVLKRTSIYEVGKMPWWVLNVDVPGR